METIDDVRNFKIYLPSSTTEKKRGRHKYTNLNISRMKRAFSMK